MLVEYPEECDFPSKNILSLVEESIHRIAPEKQDEIDATADVVTLKFTDNDKWNCSAMRMGAIILSRKTIEIIWAFCYSYHTIYKHAFANVESSGQYIDLLTDSLYDRPRRLLVWASNNLAEVEITEIPEGSPNISDELIPGSEEEEIMNIALCCISFFIHHELAHIKFGDIYSEIIIEEEACDREAVDIILSVVDEKELESRAFGVATGLLILTSMGINSKCFDGITHPLTYDRLINNIYNKIGEKFDNTIWAWVVAILTIHLANVGINPPNTVFNNFYECALCYREMLEKYGR